MTRKVLEFIKSPLGKFLLFFLAVIIFAMLLRYYKRQPVQKKPETETFNDAISIEREYVRFRDEYEQLNSGKNELIKSKQEHKLKEKDKENEDLVKRLDEMRKALAAEKAANLLKQIKVAEKPSKKPVAKSTLSLSPIDLYTAKVNRPKESPALKNYAPYGRLIKCQLFNTVDSFNFETPIIALVTENVWHDGKLIIPAGTEVHGKAASLTQRNRIATEKNWILVWRTRTGENGFELPLTATALDYARDVKTGKSGITDGSAGLLGDVIETAEYANLRLYAALFIKGAADGISGLLLEEAQTSDNNTLINSQSTESNKSSDNQLKVGVAKGVGQALELYTKKMMDAISRDGVFVRVPAGRSFYLYVTQTIDKSKAFPGAASGIKKEEPSEKSNLQEAQSLLLTLAKRKLENSQKKSKKEKQ